MPPGTKPRKRPATPRRKPGGTVAHTKASKPNRKDTRPVTRGEWANVLLQGLGKHTAGDVTFRVVAWTSAENGQGAWNPLGVGGAQNFKTYRDGIKKTIAAIRNGLHAGIEPALSPGAEDEQFIMAVAGYKKRGFFDPGTSTYVKTGKPWGTDPELLRKVLADVRENPSKYTDVVIGHSATDAGVDILPGVSGSDAQADVEGDVTNEWPMVLADKAEDIIDTLGDAKFWVRVALVIGGIVLVYMASKRLLDSDVGGAARRTAQRAKRPVVKVVRAVDSSAKKLANAPKNAAKIQGE